MKPLPLIFLAALLFLSGCASAAPTPASIAAAPRNSQPHATALPAPAFQPPVIERSQDRLDQPRETVREDHLSTFGLDVDTASYTVARDYINRGSLPPADTVRVEEFVNFFRQDYANPYGTAFGVYADGALSPFSNEGQVLLRFGIQGYRESEEDRKPRVLTFVVDVSGSMGEANKLNLVKDTLRTLLDRLDQRDTISVIAYETQAWVVLPPTNARYRFQINSAIDQLQPMGTTNLGEGLRLGYQLAEKSFNARATNRVILCTDGVANEGNINPDQILASIREYAGREITLTALGVGMGDYNDALLEQLADQGNGNYAYIDNLDEARRLFIEKLSATLDVIALNAKVQVDFNPDVVLEYRQLGYEDRQIADEDFRNDSVDAGEIGAGHSVTALYQVRLRPGAEGRISTVQLRWEDPKTHETREINGNFNTWELYDCFENASPTFQLDVLAAYFAGRLRSSAWAQVASWKDLDKLACWVSESLVENEDAEELARLVRQARPFME